jgi:hypothetical protein
MAAMIIIGWYFCVVPGVVLMMFPFLFGCAGDCSLAHGVAPRAKPDWLDGWTACLHLAAACINFLYVTVHTGKIIGFTLKTS